MFFDIKNNKQIKTLKLKYRENANYIGLINDNYLAKNYYEGFRIIDIKNGKLMEEENAIYFN